MSGGRTSSSETGLHTIKDDEVAAAPALNAGQARLWVLQELRPELSTANVAVALRVRAPLEARRLAAAWDRAAARHSALHSRYPLSGGAIRVEPGAAPELQRVEVGSEDPAAGERERAALLAEAASRPFRLADEVPVRAVLVSTADDDHAFAIVAHEIACDRASLRVLVDEVARAYDGGAGAAPEVVDASVPESADDRSWWRATLAGAPELAELPYDRPRSSTRNLAADMFATRAPSDLGGLAAQFGVTPFVVGLAGLGAVLHRYGNAEDVVVGTQVRSSTVARDAVGSFTDWLVLRLDVRDDPTFADFVRRVATTVDDARAHAGVAFETIVEELAPQRDLTRAPVFQVVYEYDDDPWQPMFAGVRGEPIDLRSGASSFDLKVEVDGGGARFEYSTELFDAGTIERAAGHVATLLASAAREPQCALSALPFLTDDEQHLLVDVWNESEAPFPRDAVIHALIAEQAARTPDAPAAVFEGSVLTYAQLDAAANQLAHHLVTLGVGPDVVVGLHVERSLDQVVGQLGILKAGGAYLPLDPGYPPDRLAFMVTDAALDVIVTQDAVVDGLPATSATVVRIGDPAIAQCPTTDPSVVVGPTNLAYVIYTSGSTGAPKGAMNEHRGLVNLATSQAKPVLGLGPESRVLQFSSFSFDACVWETFTALTSGAALHLAPRAALLPGAQLATTMRDQRITMALIPPSSLALVPPDDLPDFRVLVVGGEASTPELIARWVAPHRSVFNAYGPTEASVYCSIALLEADGRPPAMGPPIANAKVRVLDAHGRLVPVGVPGELHIGGVGVGRGYLRRPELTAEKFIADPFGASGERLYRTGDLVKLRADGTPVFAGRIDHQVKVRGYRVELGEIETVIAAHPQVQDAVVIVREDAPGDKRLVAYVVGGADVLPTVSELFAYLRDRLPHYLVPSVIAPLDRLPQTPSGKLDRDALPAPDQARPELASEYVAPRTPLEELVADVWATMLRRDQVGVYDNFYDLGGDSLLATKVVSRLLEDVGLVVPLRSMFETPTVEAIARLLVHQLADEAGEDDASELLAELDA